MDTSGNGTHFWTAVLGLVAAIVTLLAAIGGTAGFFQGGDATPGGGSAGPDAVTAAATPAATPSPKMEAATGTPISTHAVWREGTLEIPVEGDNTGPVADFDAGELVRVEGPQEARDADLIVRDTGDEVVLEPGIRQPDGATFYARFVMVGDEAAGIDGCATGDSGKTTFTRLRLFAEIEVGSHVCLVTTQGRLAEFEIVAAKLNGKQRWLEVRYTTWAN